MKQNNVPMTKTIDDNNVCISLLVLKIKLIIIIIRYIFTVIDAHIVRQD